MKSMTNCTRATLAIAWRDLKGFFAAPLFYVVAGLCALVWSYRYYGSMKSFASKSFSQMMHGRGGMGGGDPILHYEVIVAHISLVNLVLIFLIPALTMRLVAEEKKNRTYDLLLTSPISATQIVLGKYLAGLGAAWVLVLISMLYPLSTSFVATIEWGPLLTSYLGLMLLVATYVAVGLFCSSITESLVLSVVTALILCIGLWFVGAGVDIVEGPLLTKVFEHLSVGSHFMAFIKGSIRTTGVVFFLTVIFLNVFLAQRLVESSRWR